MTARQSRVSVVVVNYNTAELTIRAVDSVLVRSHGGRFVDVHVIDNASTDDSAAQLMAAAAKRDWRGRVHVTCATVNYGFGGANNVVFGQLMGRSAPPDYALLLNPDACLHGDALARLADVLDRHPDAGASGASIIGPDGAPATSAFRFPGLLGAFEDAVALRPISWLLARCRTSLPPDLQTGPVPWVSGAAVMLRLDAVRAVGGFDPRFFLYFEEVDLARRIQQSGWSVWHVAEAVVEHLEGAATGLCGSAERRRLPEYWYAAWTLYFRKTHGRAYALGAATAWLAGDALNRIAALLRGRAPRAPLYFYRDFWALAARPLLGLETRPHD